MKRWLKRKRLLKNLNHHLLFNASNLELIMRKKWLKKLKEDNITLKVLKKAN